MGFSANFLAKGVFEIESPYAVYERRLEQNRLDRTNRSKWHRFIGYAKLALGALGAFFAVRFLQQLHGITPLLVTIVAFILLAIVHELVLAKIRRLDALIAYYERGLARLDDRWAGTGEGGAEFIDESHPYSRDLDLFGRGSVFELLCTFRTRAGQQRLARWLLEPAMPNEVLTRQRAVQDLKDRTGFRENLFTAGNKIRLGLKPDLLEAWAELGFSLESRTVPVLAIALALVWVAGLVYTFVISSYWPILLVSFVNFAVNGNIRKRLGGSTKSGEEATGDLDLLVSVLRIIEQENFSADRLQNLQRSLRSGDVMASDAIKRLDRITNYLEQRRNFLVKAIDPFLFYTVLFTLWAESWRKKFGAMIGTWLAAVGEVESLAALSCYAFEHPNDVWPDFCDEGPRFDAEMLGHPLLPESRSVRNDVSFGSGLRLIVLSGPNMSGKSTFVRGIGINAVLAQCGAPVRAKSLRLSPLAVGASICVLDSLQGGISRFYAEIKRLKMISDLTHGPIPVLFLLDELLSGTNSHDRLEGSEFLVRTFVEHGAIGLITTHDLALTRIPEDMNGQARNYHFDDHLEDGKLRFDFKLKEGVVQTSNALRLMESIGLLNC